MPQRAAPSADDRRGRVAVVDDAAVAVCRVLQELPDLSIVHQRRDANQKAAPGGPFLGRTFDGVPQKARDQVARASVAKGVPSRLMRLCVLRTPLGRAGISPACPQRPHTGSSSHPHPGDEIVNRHAVVALRPEHLRRFFQRVALVEAARTSPWLGGILKHLVQKSLTGTFSFCNI